MPSKRSLIALPVVCLFLLVACAPALGAQSGAVNRIVYGLTLEPSGIDPHVNASAELGIPLRQVYDTLVYRDPNTGDYVPGLADSWEISSDGTRYTFHLKQGISFHDGTPFNAQAVAANLDRVLDPDTASQKAIFMLGPFADYEVADDYTITLILAQPYAPLLDSLSQVYLGIASPTALAAVSRERYQFHQVGTGPYEFVEYVPGDRIVIRRNPNYTWGPAFYQPPAENGIDEVEFRFVTDASARALALEAGDVQVVGEILPTDARALASESGIQLLQVGIPGQPLQFLMNTTRFPTGNRAVRQALITGANREAISAAVFQRFSPAAWGPISATTPYYFSQLQGVYAYSLDEARNLLAGAGFTDADENTYLDAEGGDMTIRVIVPPWGQIPDVAQLLEDQWRQLGIRTELVSVPTRGALFEAIGTGDFNLVAWYEFGADPALLNQYFLSDGTLNWTGYSNPSLDGLLIQAASTTDTGARAGLYAQIQQIIMQDALILPVRDYVNLNGASTRVQNLRFDRYGWFPLLPNATYVGG
ncbi:MAG: hypothetical protein IT320_08440 [Anaerolineae bacterium]|nr:hypothetical protein [Anaerolineae bacterium]